MEIKIIDNKLNVELKEGDRLLSESNLVGKRKYIFKRISNNFEYHLINEENCEVVVGIKWFNNPNKRTFLLENNYENKN